MECQRKKTASLKAREPAKTNPTEQQKEQGGADEQNPEVPMNDPINELVVEPISSDEAREENPDTLARKRLRSSSGAHLETYVPSWNIRVSDSIISKSPEAARSLGGHLYEE